MLTKQRPDVYNSLLAARCRNRLCCEVGQMFCDDRLDTSEIARWMDNGEAMFEDALHVFRERRYLKRMELNHA
jgi:hypothetical protein